MTSGPFVGDLPEPALPVCDEQDVAVRIAHGEKQADGDVALDFGGGAVGSLELESSTIEVTYAKAAARPIETWRRCNATARSQERDADTAFVCEDCRPSVDLLHLKREMFGIPAR